MTIDQTPRNDPYAPPPRHKDGSGKLVRVVILAGILGVAGAGYALYSDRIEEARNTPMVQEDRDFAEAPALPRADSQAIPPAEPAVTETAPAAPAIDNPPAPAPRTAPLPPPSTVSEGTGD